jgi:DNA-binding MarR family transcriptional regulator
MTEQNRPQLIREIFSTLEQTKRAMFAQFYQHTDKEELTPSHIHLLFLVERSQPIQLKELACRMYITPGAVTQTIENLCREDYLTRSQDERDRRTIYVSLTDKGKEKVSALKKYQQDHFTQIVSTINDDELAIYLQVQQKMLAGLEHEATNAKQGDK